MKSIYNYPFYYSIAFSFVDIDRQTKLFSDFIKKYSRIKVKRVLDLGAGPGSQARAFAKLGYDVAALDNNKAMIFYIQKRAKEENLRISAVKRNFVSFNLSKKVDFAFMLMGTIGYIKNRNELSSHLRSMARVLKKGGLYLIENFRMNENDKNLFKGQRWTMSRDGVIVKTKYLLKMIDKKKKLVEENLELLVKDGNKRLIVSNRTRSTLVPFQEFLHVLEMNGDFQFIGAFDSRRFRILARPQNRNIIVLRKR